MTEPDNPLEPRHNEVDHAKIESAVRDILAAIGEDPERDGLQAVSYTHLTLPTKA